MTADSRVMSLSDISVLAPRMKRYAIAFAGPAATSGVQFIQSLVLLRLLTAEMFGHFAFFVILTQFLLGVWSALFCAALPVIVAEGDGARGKARLATMFAANLVAAAPVVPLILLVASGMSLPFTASLLFGLFAAVSMVRSFGRAYCYAVGRQGRVMASDLAYSLVVLAGLPVLAWVAGPVIVAAAGLLALGALAGMAPLGSDYFRRQFAGFSWTALSRYGELWRMHSGWSLLGVLTTEMTLNSHAYIVTLFAGAKAFAVLAASALLTRPVSVVLTSLGEYERAHMATEIARGDATMLAQSLRFFRGVMGLVWLGTAGLLALILVAAPRLVFPAQYAVSTLAIGSALWMAVMLVRALRAPESAMLQGAGQFRPLAFASVYSAVFSVVGVTAMLWLIDPLWSIAGILLGEIVFTLCLWPVAARWRRAHIGTLNRTGEAGAPA